MRQINMAAPSSASLRKNRTSPRDLSHRDKAVGQSVSYSAGHATAAVTTVGFGPDISEALRNIGGPPCLSGPPNTPAKSSPDRIRSWSARGITHEAHSVQRRLNQPGRHCRPHL